MKRIVVEDFFIDMGDLGGQTAKILADVGDNKVHLVSVCVPIRCRIQEIHMPVMDILPMLTHSAKTEILDWIRGKNICLELINDANEPWDGGPGAA